MKVSELAGETLERWVASALGEAPGTPYTTNWAGFAQALERHAIHVAPMPGKHYQWCSVVVGKPGGRLPEGRGGWMEGPGPLVAVCRAIVSARNGSEVPDDPL
ncbi:hypothetical protein [Variovorax sp. EBFNA2]|uniref:hypothetical protein n=1 Tax=Variovorax sp. EBFNA2 TaxID=3342097 RepID=UPI0029C05473|nr:hypothetical protein [Variovorax boronicumulans]WPG35317.1 hypothetical protein RZE79_17680 [Variovorax boronicumulans]